MKFKTFQEFLSEKGISNDDYNKKSASEMSRLFIEWSTQKEAALTKKLDEVPDEETIKEINDELESLKTQQKHYETLEAEMKELRDLVENKNTGEPQTIADELKERMSEIKEIVKGNNKDGIVTKANVTRASIANNTQAIYLPDIGQLGVRERSLYNIAPKFPVARGNHNGTIKYVDWVESTTVRAAATRAEGAAFPEATATFGEFSITLQKIGDTLPVTEEFGEDEVTAAAELDMFLRVNVATVIDNQLVNGDGTAPNLTGILTTVPTYTAPDESIQDANIFDLIKRMSTAITVPRGSKYMPDFVLMNANVFDSFQLDKDAENRYLFRDIENVGPIAIIVDNYMPDNQLIVGDRRFMRIYEMDGVELSEGMTGTQFTQDLKTIKARKRIAFLIREVDKTGFLKVTNITTALTSLAP